MPGAADLTAHIVRESPVVRSPRVLQLQGMFDIPPAQKTWLEWDVRLPLGEREWNIGLIVGPSGAGKSTVARELFADAVVRDFDWPADRAILDAFPQALPTKDVVAALSAVGFGSPPSWLRPYRVLSTGERFRATVARALAERSGLVVIDEFTSVVDRQVAQVASHAIQKAVRRAGRQLIAVTCHYDVLDWLQPDWVYQPHSGEYQWRCLQRHPPMDIRVYPVHRAVWSAFRQHHYLSGELLPSAHCFGAWVGEECVAFTSYRHFPHPRCRDIKMGHRLVVLPDYQGLGLGGRLDDWLGEWLRERGFRYRNTVAHPAMVRYYARSPRWRLIRHAASLASGRRNASFAAAQTMPRRLGLLTFEYVPEAA